MTEKVLSEYFGRAVTAAAYMGEARELRDRNCESASIALLREGVQNFPEDHVLWFTLGKSLFFLRRYGEAEEAVTQALELEPTDRRARELSARISEKMRSQHHRKH